MLTGELNSALNVKGESGHYRFLNDHEHGIQMRPIQRHALKTNADLLCKDCAGLKILHASL